MKCIKFTAWNIFLILIIGAFAFFSHAKAAEILPNDVNNTGAEISSVSQGLDEGERNNFDFASLLSLLSIGLLKFVDDKLKTKFKGELFKGKLSTYKKWLIGFTTIFGILEIIIILFYITNYGPVSFGNLKNVFLGLIPVVFCVLTLITDKNESNPIVLSQDQLEIRINDFTASGMSPLGMIVGDMDFLGKVYNDGRTRKTRKKKRDDITDSSQLKAIIDNNIECIQIVCKYPSTKEAKRRIGYLADEFENRFQIHFFDEEKIPFPKMRGRIMFTQKEQVVVITKKIRKPSKYEYGEYPVSSLPGGIFADLWNTVWGGSIEAPQIIEECKDAYLTYVGKK